MLNQTRTRLAIAGGLALALAATAGLMGGAHKAPSTQPKNATYSLILQSRGEVYELDYNLTISDCFAELHASALHAPSGLTCQNMGN